MNERQLETFITLVLEDTDSGLALAHRNLYPERIPEMSCVVEEATLMEEYAADRCRVRESFPFSS
jgi:hypothetical protein